MAYLCNATSEQCVRTMDYRGEITNILGLTDLCTKPSPIDGPELTCIKYLILIVIGIRRSEKNRFVGQKHALGMMEVFWIFMQKHVSTNQLTCLNIFYNISFSPVSTVRASFVKKCARPVAVKVTQNSLSRTIQGVNHCIISESPSCKVASLFTSVWKIYLHFTHFVRVICVLSMFLTMFVFWLDRSIQRIIFQNSNWAFTHMLQSWRTVILKYA